MNPQMEPAVGIRAITSMPSNKQLALRNGSHKSHTSRARARVRQRAFLKSLARNPNISEACAVSGIPRRSVYDLRAADETFASEWDAALDASVDRVEETAFRMANEGDSGMVQFVLKAFRPSRYRETSRVELDARVGGIVFLPEKEKGAE
jgi:hypothetical protein